MLSALIEGCCDSGEGLGGARERTDPVGFCVDTVGIAGISVEVGEGDDDVDELDRVRSRPCVRLPLVDELLFAPEGLEEGESGDRAWDGVGRPLELELEEVDLCWGTGGGCGVLLKLDDRTAGGRFPPAPDRELRDELAEEPELVLCRAYGGCAACNGGKADGGNPAIVLGGAGDGEDEPGEPVDDVDCDPRVLLYGWND